METEVKVRALWPSAKRGYHEPQLEVRLMHGIEGQVVASHSGGQSDIRTKPQL